MARAVHDRRPAADISELDVTSASDDDGDMGSACRCTGTWLDVDWCHFLDAIFSRPAASSSSGSGMLTSNGVHTRVGDPTAIATPRLTMPHIVVHLIAEFCWSALSLALSLSLSLSLSL